MLSLKSDFGSFHFVSAYRYATTSVNKTTVLTAVGTGSIVQDKTPKSQARVRTKNVRRRMAHCNWDN